MQILEAHLSQFSYDHVNHLIATAEVVVERDGHPILQAALADSFLQRNDFRTSLLIF